jgi:hypothetical protein
MDNLITPISVKADLDKGIKKTYLDMIFATQDDKAHRVDVQLVRGKEQVDLSGATVTAYFIRYSDNATISLEGEVSGGIVSVKMKKACYNKPGSFALIIKATVEGVTNTVFYGEGSIFVSITDTIVDEENVIPSLEDLLNQIAVMERATADASTATSAANTAADRADAAADDAKEAATQIAGMTVSATNATTAGATISEKNGVKHIAFDLPAGVTPQIHFEVETGAPGTDVLMTQSGTIENPVIHLTIPRGDTGAVDGIDYFEGAPKELGTASPGQANGLARGDHVHPMPTANDVGALEKDGTAVNSEKLGGKAPEYYIQPRNLLDNSDFTNPVNQRGVTSKTIYGYTIDRWLMYPADDGAEYSVTMNDGYISLVNAKFEQKIERYIAGAVYTAAAKKTDGSVVVFSGDFRSDAITEGPIYLKISSSGHATFGITNGDYVWTALYEGEYTAETLPPYVPKGYAAELAECQRYFRRFGSIGVGGNVHIGFGQASTSTIARCSLYAGAIRIVNPSYSLNGTMYLRHGATDHEVVGAQSVVVQNEVLYALFESEGLTSGEMYALRFIEGVYLDISADL